MKPYPQKPENIIMDEYMQLIYKPAGGRYGYGFNFYCPVCKQPLGNSNDDKVLEHSEVHYKVRDYFLFFWTSRTPSKCPNAGKVFEVPQFLIEAKEISSP